MKGSWFEAHVTAKIPSNVYLNIIQTWPSVKKKTLGERRIWSVFFLLPVVFFGTLFCPTATQTLQKNFHTKTPGQVVEVAFGETIWAC